MPSGSDLELQEALKGMFHGFWHQMDFNDAMARYNNEVVGSVDTISQSAQSLFAISPWRERIYN